MIAKVVAAVEKQPGVVHKPIVPIYFPSKTGVSSEVALIIAYPTTPQAAATTNLIYHLRDVTIPAAVGTAAG